MGFHSACQHNWLLILFTRKSSRFGSASSLCLHSKITFKFNFGARNTYEMDGFLLFFHFARQRQIYEHIDSCKINWYSLGKQRKQKHVFTNRFRYGFHFVYTKIDFRWIRSTETHISPFLCRLFLCASFFITNEFS